MQRRRFIVKAGGVLAAAGAAAVVDAPNVIAQPKVQWRMSTTWTRGARRAPGCGPAAGEGRRGDERRAVPDRGLRAGGEIMPPFECFDATSQGTIEAFMAAPFYWAAEGARDPVVPHHPVRHEPRGHGGLVLPGRRAQADGGGVRRLQPRAAPGHGAGSADGWMVPEEDHHDRRLQGPQDAHCRLSAARSSQGGWRGGPHPGRRDLRRARAGRDRRRRMGRAARRHEAGPAQDRTLLLLPGLARAWFHERVRLQQEGVRGAPGRSPADAGPCHRGDPGLRSHGLPRRRMRSRSSDSPRSSRARSRSSSSRCRCCAISRNWRPRSSRKSPRRAPWPGRCTRPSRSSRRW